MVLTEDSERRLARTNDIGLPSCTRFQPRSRGRVFRFCLAVLGFKRALATFVLGRRYATHSPDVLSIAVSP